MSAALNVTLQNNGYDVTDVYTKCSPMRPDGFIKHICTQFFLCITFENSPCSKKLKQLENPRQPFLKKNKKKKINK